MESPPRRHPAVQRYLSELATCLHRAPRNLAAESLADAEEFLLSEWEALQTQTDRLSDEAVYARFVEKLGTAAELADGYTVELDPGQWPAARAVTHGNGRPWRRRAAVLTGAFVAGAACMAVWTVFTGDSAPWAARRVAAQGLPHLRFQLDPARWADRVVSCRPGEQASTVSQSPEASLGSSDFEDGSAQTNHAVSLGLGGELIVEFTDNELRDEPGVDLKIYAVGYVEPMRVAVSNDLKTWHELGIAKGHPAAIDLAEFKLPQQSFRYVRITDAEGGRTSDGADIDAIAANPLPAGAIRRAQSVRPGESTVADARRR